MKRPILMFATLALAACMRTGEDPQKQGGPQDTVGAVQQPAPPPPGARPADGQAAPTPTQGDALAQCRTLEAGLQRECELRVQQGFDRAQDTVTLPPDGAGQMAESSEDTRPAQARADDDRD